MLARWSTIGAALVGCAVASSAAHADWEIHSSSARRAEQGIRALVARPEDDVLAARLVRELGARVAATLLDRAERYAAARPEDYGAQLVCAQFLLSARHWAEAAAQFEKAAVLAPAAPAPRWGRARALVGKGDVRAAIAELRATLALTHGSAEILKVARELTTVAVGAADLDAEVEARRAWAAARPSDRASVDLAGALERAGHHAEAATILAAAAGMPGRAGPDRTRLAMAESRSLAAAGDLNGAALVLKRARQDLATGWPDLRRELWNQRIEIARRLGSLDELKSELAAPHDWVDWIARARIADEQGNLRESWRAFDEAIRIRPGDVNLRRLRIAVARRIGSTGEVVALFEDLGAVARGAREGDAVIGEILEGLWQLGRPDVAGRLFDGMLVMSRGNASRLRVMAEAAGRWGDDRRAESAWKALLRRNPRDEMAIIALGEALFQRGQRRAAIDTWRGLLSRGHEPGEAHAQLGEVLVDHDLLDQALGEARAALVLSPDRAQHHRLMARILERQTRARDAEVEWETALRLARGPGRGPERREARARLVGLWVREGSGRVEAKLQELERSQRKDESDRETLAFLVEVQLRTGRTEAAIDVLRAALSKAGDADADVDLLLLLVRTLRQVHRADEAMAWLEELARRYPERARDARLQLADIALAEHADERAQAFAQEAAADAPGDSRVVLRAAAVQERLGHFDQALAMYRRLVEPNRDPAAVLALASLLARLGETEEQRDLLRRVLREGTDDEIVGEAGRRAIALEEAQGSLEALEAYLADAADLNAAAGAGLVRRRILATVLARVVPAAYRQQRRDAAALMKLRRFARHGLRPLLDLIGAPDADLDPGVVEVLGMLGRPEAVPELARMVAPDGDAEDRNAVTRPISSTRDELAAGVVIALGRLGGEAARAALESVAEQSRSTPRLPILWALGRVGGPVAVRLAKLEIARAATDGAVIGCLTLGRAGGPEEGALLEAIISDHSRAKSVRLGAVLGLGLGQHRASIELLAGLANAGDPELARAARVTLARLERGNEGGRRETKPEPAVDEAVTISGGHIDPESLLQVLLGDVHNVVGASTEAAPVENSADAPHLAP